MLTQILIFQLGQHVDELWAMSVDATRLASPLTGLATVAQSTPSTNVSEPVPSSHQTRAGRRVRPTWKVRDMIPEDAGDHIVEEAAGVTGAPAPQVNDSAPSDAPPRPRVLLLLTDYVRTAANSFGLKRFYKRRPHRPPKARRDLESIYAPTADAAAAKKRPKRSVSEVIFPFPNLSSWRFAWHYNSGHKKTLGDRDAMKTLVTRPDFVAADIADTDFDKMNQFLANGVTEETPWVNEREGWRKSSITIGIPLGKKSTQASRRDAAAATRRINRHEPQNDTPPAHAISGQHFTVHDFHHKSICAEIRKTLTSNPAVHDFVFDPYHVEFQAPNSDKVESVYGEFYNSTAFVQEDLKLQNSPREPGCELPRAIIAIMLASDATIVSQFGGKKAWPGYMFFGNQSKYTRARPTAHAAHHIAYFIGVGLRTIIQIRNSDAHNAIAAGYRPGFRQEEHQRQGCYSSAAHSLPA